MEDINKELTPILAKLLTRRPGDKHQPEVIQLHDWLIQPDRTAEEFQYAVGPLNDHVYMLLDDYVNYMPNTLSKTAMIELQNTLGLSVDDIYNAIFSFERSNKHNMLRTAAEALAARCPVLEGRWEQIAWCIFVPLGERNVSRNLNYLQEYGDVSQNLSSWIIQVVGNPEMCPNVKLRYQILLLYKTLVNINHDNYKQALESFMSMCYFIDKLTENDSTIDKAKAILECLMLFKKETSRDKLFECHMLNVDPREEFLYKFGLTVTETLTSYRSKMMHIHLHDISHDYSMGLKTINEPKELLGLTQLIQYLSNLAWLEYEAFQDMDEYNIENLLVSSWGLVNIVRGFHTALHDPILISIIAESIVDVLESVLLIMYHEQGGVASRRTSHALLNVDLLLDEIFHVRDESDDDAVLVAYPIGMEIVTKFKTRICYIKSQINEDFVAEENVTPTLYTFFSLRNFARSEV